MNSAEFRRQAHGVVDWIADYLDTIEPRAPVPDVRPGDIRRQLPAEAPEQGEPFERIFADFERIIVPGLAHWQHPGWFAYFASNASPPSILAEMLAAGVAVNCMSWATSPAATELEQVTLDWLRRLLGFPEAFSGVIQDTASTATFTATIVGRDQAWRRAGRDARLVFYASEEAHSSVWKAARLAGFGESDVRRIATDAAFAMQPDALAAALEADQAQGRVPAVVVATIGSTSSTAIDPVPVIGRLTRTHGSFLHVDAAWAGSAALLPECRHYFAGLELADSVVVNPHKWLGVHFDCTAHYVRDPGLLQQSFALTPEYLRSVHDAEVVNYRDWGIPLGRRFRALKLWMVLRNSGAEALRAMIRQHLRWGESFGSWVDADPEFERMAPVSFALVCFRHRPAGLDEAELDQHNRRLLALINASGRVHLIGTSLRGRFVIRMAIGQRSTEERHVREAWDIIRASANRTGEG
jgi:aromatic-L-amino-acid decarboxylase